MQQYNTIQYSFNAKIYAYKSMHAKMHTLIYITDRSSLLKTFKSKFAKLENFIAHAAPRSHRRRRFFGPAAPPPPTKIELRASADTMTSAQSSILFTCFSNQ